MNTNLNINLEDVDLLEILKYILGCTYISDLRVEHYYNDNAKLILNYLDLKRYSQKQLKDVFEYIYDKN